MSNNKQAANNATKDRYVSFLDISCDDNADTLMAILDKHIQANNGAQQWRDYFTQKRQQQQQLKHDNLNFIGHQTNTLYEYFSSCEDQQASSLLYKIEQQCC